MIASPIRLITPVLLVSLCGLAAGPAQAQSVTTPAEEKVAIAPAKAGEAASEAIGEFVVRFFASDAARKDALPSMFLNGAVNAMGPVPEGFSILPRFTSADGVQSVVIPAEAGTSFYGTGLVSGSLERNGTSIVTGAAPGSLGQSHPWVLGVRPGGSSFGVFADTSYPCTVTVGKDGITFSAGGPAFPVIAIERPSPHQVLIALGELTGRVELPARWALGFHYGRAWSDGAQALDFARSFREKELPCDSLIFGPSYTSGGHIFSFDPKNFSDPRELNRRLNFWGFNTVWELGPTVRKEKNYFMYDGGTSGDAWLKTAAGEPVMASGVTGEMVLPDFSDRESRLWWATQIKTFFKNNKMQGIFTRATGPLIPDTAAFGPSDDLAGPHGNPADVARFRGQYGMLMSEACKQGLLAAEPGNRPFILTASNALGGQRSSASTVGDLPPTWEGLREVLPRVLNLGLSGQPFAGSNIGGEIAQPAAGGEASSEDGRLYARWMALGSMLPLAYSESGAAERTPWGFGPEVEETCRLALQRRYRLVPFFYTLFRESSLNNLPVARPVFFADPKDSSLRSEARAFVLGNDLMVVPKPIPGDTDPVALPKGWRKFDFPVHKPAQTEKAGPDAAAPDRFTPSVPSATSSMQPYDTKGWPHDGANEDLPDLYIRPGAVIPTGPVIGHTNSPIAPITFLVNLDESGKAEGRMYSDPGDLYSYRDVQFFRAVLWQASRDGDKVTLAIGKEEGVIPNAMRSVIVRVLLPDGGEAVAMGNETTPVVVDLMKDKK